MAKRTIFIILTFSIGVGAIAQEELIPVWIKTVQSEIDAKCEPWGVDVDEEGNVYWPVNVNNKNQSLDIICYKYDENGMALWNTPLTLGGGGTQQSYVCTVKDTALYIGGRFCPLAVQSCDMYLVKAHKETQKVYWEQTIDFGQDGYEEVDGLEIREDGIYCGGWAHAFETGTFHPDIGLWKLDHSGNTEWTNHLGKTGTAEHQDGHFVVDEQYIYAAGLWGGSGFGNLANGYSFLGKFERDGGTLVDSVLFGDQSDDINDVENALGMATDGEYLYVTGYTTPDTLDHWQLFVAKFEKDLDMIWMRDWGGTGAESARAIVVDDGIIYIAGRSSSPEIIQNNKEDAVLLAFTSNGDLVNYKVWGDENVNVFRDIVVDDESIYLSGASAEDLPNGNDQTAFLLKASKSDLVSSKHFSESKSISLFPNPSNGTITIDLSKLPFDDYTFEIFDLSGKRISSCSITHLRQQYQLPVGEGVYFYRISNPGEIIKAGQLVVTER